MKRVFGQIERWVSQTFPNAYYRFVQVPRFQARFSIERQLIRGKKLSTSERPSILFYTTQKCASRFVGRTIGSLAASAGMIQADYDAYVTMLRVPKEQHPFRKEGSLAQAFDPRGYYYGPIGTYREISSFHKYRVILQLRDPRDVLTSLYFSTGFSHAVISKKLIRRRKEALAQSIDQFVLDYADEYLAIYTSYCQKLLGRENTLFLKYEDMVTDFPIWLDRLSSHLGLSDQVATLKQLGVETQFSVRNEDRYSQKRQVTPGDHLRKLRPETIAELNSRFDVVLKRLSY